MDYAARFRQPFAGSAAGASPHHVRDSGEERPALDGELMERLGRRIGASYASVLDEPLPARFRDLLRRLDAERAAVRV